MVPIAGARGMVMPSSDALLLILRPTAVQGLKLQLIDAGLLSEGSDALTLTRMPDESEAAMLGAMSRIDVVAWINTVVRDPETGRPFQLLPAEIAFLERAFQLDEEGRAIYPELVYSAPKKSGKTGFAAILTLVATLLYGGRDPEAICTANDLEQSASRVFSAIKKIIRASPASATGLASRIRSSRSRGKWRLWRSA
jgi:hypothetical protein